MYKFPIKQGDPFGQIMKGILDASLMLTWPLEK